MGNKIVYGNYTFTDDVILSAQLTLSNAMVSESLSGDEFKFTVYSTQTTDLNYLRTVLNEYYTTVNDEHFGLYFGAIQNYRYGAPIYYYKDETLQGKYYISKITRTGRYTFDFECVSAVGLLIKINHNGGVYENSTKTVGSLVREIFTKIGAVENTDYIIDSAVDSVPVNGWLPYASCRDNLRQVLFAVGASIVKEESGKISIKYISSPTLKNIPDERIYLGGDVNYLTPASSVEVWEHEYHSVSTDQFKLLFDNTTESTANNELITFEKPCHPDIDTGEWVITGNLTVSEIGANYAIVSGIGTLGGYEYSHTTRVLTENILNNGQKNVVTVKDATLVSTLNSKNVTKRVAAYYSQAKEITCDIALADDDLKPSSKVTFTDAFGDSRIGYIKSMNIGVSKTDKATTIISVDWTPSHFGNNYTNYVLLTNGTTWTSPVTGTVRFVLIGGGQGGQGGFNGSKGTAGEKKGFTFNPPPYTADGGTGGACGTGGNGGKIYTFDVNVTEETTYQISLGQGGAGGASNGGLGTDGTPTTITIGSTTYSSANGVVNNNGHVNSLTGDVYANIGWNGIKGGDALKEVLTLANFTETVQVQVSNNEYQTFTFNSGNKSSTEMYNAGAFGRAYGACGGAGAFGTNGGNAGEYYWYSEDEAHSRLLFSADGGDGANAKNLDEAGITYSLNIGQGGVGGNGGGASAGGAHIANNQNIPEADISSGYFYVTGGGSAGDSGTGSTGCTGANGGILIYY